MARRERVRGEVCDGERGAQAESLCYWCYHRGYLPTESSGVRGALGRKTVKSKRRKRETSPAEGTGLSRREFARRAGVAAAAIAAIPGGVLGMADTLPGSREVPLAPLQEAAGGTPKLSAEALGEAEGKVAEIIRRYGAKLSEAQKADVRRLMREAQEQIEALRAFPLENSDEPATVFHLVGAASRGAGTTRRAPAASSPPGAPGGKKPAKGDA